MTFYADVVGRHERLDVPSVVVTMDLQHAEAIADLLAELTPDYYQAAGIMFEAVRMLRRGLSGEVRP